MEATYRNFYKTLSIMQKEMEISYLKFNKTLTIRYTGMKITYRKYLLNLGIRQKGMDIIYCKCLPKFGHQVHRNGKKTTNSTKLLASCRKEQTINTANFTKLWASCMCYILQGGRRRCTHSIEVVVALTMKQIVFIVSACYSGCSSCNKIYSITFVLT